MINLILFLVQNVASDIIRDDVFRHILSCDYSAIRLPNFDSPQNCYRVSYVILQLYSTLYQPYI